MYNVKSLKAEEFISDKEILDTLAYADANKDNVELIDIAHIVHGAADQDEARQIKNAEDIHIPGYVLQGHAD